MLDQLRKGLLFYDIPKVMNRHPDDCLPMSVPGDNDTVKKIAVFPLNKALMVSV